MQNHCWHTEEAHADNSVTMSDYLEHEMDPSWEVIVVDGTYAEVLTDCGEKYALYAGGNGDFNNHMMKFEKLNT